MDASTMQWLLLVVPLCALAGTWFGLKSLVRRQLARAHREQEQAR